MKVLHLNYRELTNSHFQSYQKGNIFLNWIYCSNYSPLKCEKKFMITLIVCVAISVINGFTKPVQI